MLVRHRCLLKAHLRRSSIVQTRRQLHASSLLWKSNKIHESKKETAELNRINSKLTEQLAALDQMTKSVKTTLKQKEMEKIENDVSKETTMGILEDINNVKGDEPTEQDIDQIFSALGISDSESPSSTFQQIPSGDKITINVNDESELMNLFPAPRPYIDIPLSVKNSLTPELLSNITRKETSNWEPVIDRLLKSSICNPLESEIKVNDQFTGFDFHHLVRVIPRNQKIKMVEKLHELALLSGVLWGNVHVMNDLLALCNLLPATKAKFLVDALLRDIEFSKENREEDMAIQPQFEEKIIANNTTKAILLNHYARLTDVNNVRKYVAQLNELPDNENPMNNSPVVYTSIMQMYIRMGDYELAKQTFDTMKFLSVKTSPSSHTYTSMILLDTLNNNIEHGISVYEEMIEKEIPLEAEALLALAKGCGARRGMVSHGWEFIIKYYESGFPVDRQVMEIMMYLAYVDCDLAFVRGIWMNICETNTKIAEEIQLPHPKCTKWLFNTYYKIGEVHEQRKNGQEQQQHVPVGLIDSRVKAIRTKVLELTNYGFHEKAPPLLPLVSFDGADSQLIMSEARALWKYILEYNSGRYISEELVEAYLYVVGRYARLETFQSEWARLTIFDDSGIEKNRKELQQVTIEEPEAESEETMDDSLEINNTEEVRVTATTNREQQTPLPFGRYPRTDRLYNMCMHIARHQGSLSFAQKIWTERGEYRKSFRFQALKPNEQDAADFKFARLMLSTLTFTGNVGDAYKLVLSSQNRFVWSKYHLKSLLSVCERLGYTTFAKELVKVTRRADRWARRRQKQQQ